MDDQSINWCSNPDDEEDGSSIVYEQHDNDGTFELVGTNHNDSRTSSQQIILEVLKALGQLDNEDAIIEELTIKATYKKEDSVSVKIAIPNAEAMEESDPTPVVTSEHDDVSKINKAPIIDLLEDHVKLGWTENPPWNLFVDKFIDCIIDNMFGIDDGPAFIIEAIGLKTSFFDRKSLTSHDINSIIDRLGLNYQIRKLLFVSKYIVERN